MSFYYMLLGHLIGDFTLQTDEIAHKKIHSRKWNAMHAGIVTICILLFSMSFGAKVLLLVLLSGVLHYYIDWYKPRVSEKFPLPPLVSFVIDQCIHMATLYLISLFAVPVYESLLLPLAYLKIMFAVVFLTSFCGVFNQLVVKMLVQSDSKEFFQAGEKHTGNITRLYIAFSLYLSIVYSPWALLLMAVILINVAYQYKSIWKSWMSTGHLAVKLVMDVVMALIVTGLLLQEKQLMVACLGHIM